MLAACASSSPDVEGDGVEVATVFDGDTVQVRGSDGTLTDVRLVGVNAPERDECYGPEAGDYLTDAIGGEGVVVVETGLDQFGRTLGHIYLGDSHLNHDLVETGHAIATTDDGIVQFEAAERRAIDADLGLWSTTACGVGLIPVVDLDVDPFSELVTITNNGDAAVDMDRWIIRDESSRHRYHFPSGSAVGAGGQLVVASTDTNWQPGGSNVWNNDGDMAILQLPDGRVVDQHRYGP